MDKYQNWSELVANNVESNTLTIEEVDARRQVIDMLDTAEYQQWLSAIKKIESQEDWIRRVIQFANRYCEGDVRTCTYLLKEVHNWKTWLDLNREYKDVDYTTLFEDRDETKVQETIACGGGACEVNFG